MRRQSENIDSLIRALFTIGLFIIVHFAFRSPDCTSSNSSNQGAANEQVSGTGNLGIPAQPISFRGLENSLVTFDTLTYNSDDQENFRIICSDNRTNNLLLLCKERFKEIKPQIIDHHPHLIRASLNNGEVPLIS
jgi:hypothetical protein